MPEVAVLMTENRARALTAEIRLIVGSVYDQIERLKGLVDEAEAGNAHEVLGYASWTAYLVDVLGDQKLHLRRADRQELVGFLADKGMSTRGTAAALGVSKNTVTADRQVSQPGTPEPAPSPRDVDSTEDAVAGLRRTMADNPGPALDAPTTKYPTPTTGLDGKRYPRIDRPRRRAPLPDAFRSATFELTKAIGRVSRLLGDDRFDTNAASIALVNHSDLVRARNALQGMIDRLDGAPTLGGDDVPDEVISSADIVIEVGDNSAVVLAGEQQVRGVINWLKITQHQRDPITKRLMFSAKLVHDIAAALEHRHQVVELRHLDVGGDEE